MRRKVLFIIVIMFSIFFSQKIMAQSGILDVVYLKNGSIVKGIIIENTPNANIKLKTSDGSLFVYNYDEIEKFAKEEVVNRRNNYYSLSVNEKNPGLALLFSLLIPGGGQYYNGETSKGVTMTGIGLGAIVLTTVAANEGASELSAIGSLIALGNSIWSMIDAPISANRINRQNAIGLINLDLGNGNYLSLSPDFQCIRHPVSLGKPENVMGLRLKLTL